MRKEVDGTVGEHATGLNAGSDAYLSKQAFTKDFILEMHAFSGWLNIHRRVSRNSAHRQTEVGRDRD